MMGFTQAHLAGLLDIKTALLSKWERAEMPIPAAFAAKINSLALEPSRWKTLRPRSSPKEKRPPIPNMHRKHIGALAEIIACEWLFREGYEVFRNISAVGLADYIAWKPGQLPVPIDVKGIVANTAVKASETQRVVGVKILLVDVRTRAVSFSRADFRPQWRTRGRKVQYRSSEEPPSSSGGHIRAFLPSAEALPPSPETPP